MAVYKTGVKGFDDAAMAAEMARQVALAGVTNQGTANGISLTYLQTVINAGSLYNVLTINEQSGAQALAGG